MAIFPCAAGLCSYIGHMYDKGEGVEQNDLEAVKWYRMAAEQGLAEAQMNLGFMVENGRGAQQNSSEAVVWYRRAAKQGEADAQNNLGFVSSG